MQKFLQSRGKSKLFPLVRTPVRECSAAAFSADGFLERRNNDFHRLYSCAAVSACIVKIQEFMQETFLHPAKRTGEARFQTSHLLQNQILRHPMLVLQMT